MARPTITAAIIAQDEAHHLPGLLARLKWVDEVVLVDGGSRDSTVEVARAHGARVRVRRFDHFARQRNFALGLARGDWVLAIDADERPTAAFIAEVCQRIMDTRAAAFRVPIRSAIFGRRFRFAGTQDDRPIRLLRRGTACWQGEVHEVLHVRGQVGQLRNWLEHETTPDLSVFLAKMDRYTTLAAQARVASHQPPRRRERWFAPPREVFRRLLWKKGLLDGPEGWAFCFLSGLSEWVLADKHRRLWEAGVRSAECGVRSAKKSLQRAAISPPMPHPALRLAHSALRPGAPGHSARANPHSALST